MSEMVEIDGAKIAAARQEVEAEVLPSDGKTAALAILDALARIAASGGGTAGATVNGAAVPLVFLVRK